MKKQKTLLLIFLILIHLAFTSCKKSEEFVPDDFIIVTFDEANVQTVTIGDQVWMAENLKVTVNSNGNRLNGVYAYNDNESNVAEYGRLYTWQAALNAQPPGWHLPSEQEWNILVSTLGANPVAKLIFGGSSGFNAKFGGRLASGNYGYMGEIGMYWTSTASGNEHAVQILLVNNETEIQWDNTPVNCGLSVRYVRD